MCIGWSGAQPRVLDGTAYGEVVEALPIVARQSECPMQHIIKIATNAGAAHPCGLASQIQRLANHPRLPE